MINLRSLFSLTGINPKITISIRYFPKYLVDLAKWVLRGGKAHKLYPQLSDYSDSAGSMRGHYFHQDLIVSQKIYQANPDTHIDIGSRIDGFVAHVAAFRKIKILDIRALEKSQHPNIEFLQADLMKPLDIEPVESVSCLHALEHFGMGRYGDNIDPDGHITGLINISKLVKPGGFLYLSFPVSQQNRIEFNAHRVINPTDLFTRSGILSEFSVINFDLIDDSDVIHRQHNYTQLNSLRYGCGIFTLMKEN